MKFLALVVVKKLAIYDQVYTDAVPFPKSAASSGASVSEQSFPKYSRMKTDLFWVCFAASVHSSVGSNETEWSHKSRSVAVVESQEEQQQSDTN